jgi:beta-1,2-mannobiose phosphorylase / 1,2-beta-oligomannan phosphorylase
MGVFSCTTGHLCRPSQSVMEPTAELERHGFVPDVVFPTGIVETETSYLVYYGAADSGTAVVEFSKHELLATMV